MFTMYTSVTWGSVGYLLITSSYFCVKIVWYYYLNNNHEYIISAYICTEIIYHFEIVIVEWDLSKAGHIK